MKFNFKKIVSVLTSTVMLGSTIALAAAANYPDPFIKGGKADVAVVYGGSSAANTDLVASMDILSQLSKELSKQTIVPSGGSSASTSVTGGESVALFTSGTKLYINDPLDNVKGAITDSDLKTLLKENTFSGNVDSKITQSITITKSPSIEYAKAPTTSDEPAFGINLTTSTSAAPLYKASATFAKRVNFTHADSVGSDLFLFGQKFTVSADTDVDTLVLLKTAKKVSLSSDSPASEVEIGGKKYTVELVSASDTAATVKVTDSDGKSESKEINENKSKKIQGITVAVTNADETNLKLSANVIAGAEKVTLENGNAVTTGDNNNNVDGTLVSFVDSNIVGNISQIVINVTAPNSDKDFIKPGNAFVDPVFSTFKIDFSGVNIPLDGTAREDIKVAASGTHTLSVTFADHKSKEAKTIQYARNVTNGGAALQIDSSGRNLTVIEAAPLKKDGYAVIGNEDEGFLIKVAKVSNSSSTTASDDQITFKNVFTGADYSTSISSEGSGTVAIEGKSYTVAYTGANSVSEEARSVSLRYPDGGSGIFVAYPTIQTSKGAKLFFYTPLNLTLDNMDNIGQGSGGGTDISTLKIPNFADGYTSVTFTPNLGTHNEWNVTVGSTTSNLSTNYSLGTRINITSARLTFSIGNYSLGTVVNGVQTAGGSNTLAGSNQTQLVLLDPQNGAPIMQPAVVIVTEKDDNSNYEALIVNTRFSSDKIGINEVIRTWTSDAMWEQIQSPSNTKIYKEADLWGSVITVDQSSTDQYTATISYPDEQVHALVYVADNAAEIKTTSATGGSGATEVTSVVTVSESEVSSVSTKNLVVLGGSCVNSVAAKLLGSSTPLCGADFTSKSGAGAGQYVIETFESPYAADKVATLVAGYNAQDTTNAAKYFTTQTLDTMKGKKYLGTTGTVAELQVAASAATPAATTPAASTGNISNKSA